MPRFYFDIIEGDTRIFDEEGLECTDVASASERAVHGLRSIIASEVGQGRVNLGMRIVIHDGQVELSYVTAREAVQLVG